LRRSLAALLLAVVACGGSGAETEPTSLTFMAGFTPQANLPFVGVYVADTLGYFADEGLEVEIRHSGPGGENLQLLASGEVDVTTMDAGVLLQRRSDPGLPLVSIGLVGQRGQQAFVALAESGIETPEDWQGRLVGYKGTPPPDVFALLEAAGLDESDVTLINVGFDPRILTEGQVDVYPVFKSNEPNLLSGWGFEVNMWEAADYGAPTLGLTYVASEDGVANKPEVLAAFMRAAIRGIEYGRENPAETIDIVMEHVGPDGDREHQLYMLETESADAVSETTDAHGIGWQTEDQWAALQDFLIRYDALTSPIDVTEAFTTEFLP